MDKEDKIVPLDDPEFLEAQQKREAALQALSDIGQEMEKSRKVYEHDNDAWWDGLSETEREDAFYAVCKRLQKGELKERGSYRYVLYNVFGFDPGMYARGMDCGFMALHNSIYDGEELVEMKSVTRFEVIDETGRAYTKYLKDDEGIKYSLQDDKRTLKVFIDNTTWKADL
jgi:hypothetical protein